MGDMGKRSTGVKVLVWFAAALVLMTAGCKKKEAPSAERVINVQTLAAEQKSFRPLVEAVGTLKPDQEVIASSQVEGLLKQVRVDEGTPVSRGMVLASVDDTDYRLEVRRAEAALKQTEATLANTKVEYQRKNELFKEQLVTQQQYDDVTTRMALADAEVDRAKAALDLAKERFAKTKIYSPLQGYVKEKKVSAGDYVRNGTPLFSLIKVDPIKLLFTVTEKDVGKLKVGQQVQFKVDSMPGKEFTARVSIVYPSLEERTRTLQVEAQASNRGGQLKPGLFSRVILYTEEARMMMVVPITSILYDSESTKIFIVEGDRAKERKVKLGGKYGEWIEVVEGLKAGETVVVVGQNNLAEGVKVHVAR
jgi:membrane fusion protein (multidrug efflux system)